MKHAGLTVLMMLVLSFANLTAADLHAQETQEPVVEEPKIRVLPPAYENQMVRLAEILGALHYLRELCGANEEQLWRDQIKNMIKQEEPTQERRAMLIARFNRAFAVSMKPTANAQMRQLRPITATSVKASGFQPKFQADTGGNRKSVCVHDNLA